MQEKLNRGQPTWTNDEGQTTKDKRLGTNDWGQTTEDKRLGTNQEWRMRNDTLWIP